jgi:hypothetical protein
MNTARAILGGLIAALLSSNLAAAKTIGLEQSDDWVKRRRLLSYYGARFYFEVSPEQPPSWHPLHGNKWRP